jgi:hypothetical protein
MPARAVTPPVVPPLPKLPSVARAPRAQSEPSIIVSPDAYEPVPTPVEDPTNTSVEIDLVGDDDPDGRNAGPTHVGPPPVADDVPVEPDTQVRLPVADDADPHLDVNPEDIAAIEKQKRKKRLTDGWED